MFYLCSHWILNRTKWFHYDVGGKLEKTQPYSLLQEDMKVTVLFHLPRLIQFHGIYMLCCLPCCFTFVLLSFFSFSFSFSPPSSLSSSAPPSPSFSSSFLCLPPPSLLPIWNNKQYLKQNDTTTKTSFLHLCPGCVGCNSILQDFYPRIQTDGVFSLDRGCL